MLHPEDWEDLQESVDRMARRLAPAAVDPRPIEVLTRRLMDDSDEEETEFGLRHSLTSPGIADKQGTHDDYSVALYENPHENKQASLEMRDALYRRSFSHLEGVTSRWTPLKGGETQAEIWVFIVGLDAQILEVSHQILVGRIVGDSFIEDETRTMARDESPSDPAILRRWKEMSDKFLKMRRALRV